MPKKASQKLGAEHKMALQPTFNLYEIDPRSSCVVSQKCYPFSPVLAFRHLWMLPRQRWFSIFLTRNEGHKVIFVWQRKRGVRKLLCFPDVTNECSLNKVFLIAVSFGSFYAKSWYGPKMCKVSFGLRPMAIDRNFFMKYFNFSCVILD